MIARVIIAVVAFFAGRSNPISTFRQSAIGIAVISIDGIAIIADLSVRIILCQIITNSTVTTAGNAAVIGTRIRIILIAIIASLMP